MLPAPTSTPMVTYKCHGCVVSGASNKPLAISTTPSSITLRGPSRSIRRPISGLTPAETTKPNEKAPAVTPRSHPNSSMIAGKNSENAVRALTPIAMVTNVTAIMIQP
ncbi:hypothetical protein GALL_531240 [mine drainage metagenome]|uniref:Uncharacterized protein n=1 Tax=mine drainage metagenome TaxID=410659 RepID=A0A1J5P3S2_9ZZZZ